VLVDKDILLENLGAQTENWASAHTILGLLWQAQIRIESVSNWTIKVLLRRVALIVGPLIHGMTVCA
jgi:hypothetical protein